MEYLGKNAFDVVKWLLSMIFGLLLFNPLSAFCKDYHVGPGQSYTKLSEIQWSGLSADDTVYIHSGTYREKFAISSRGTAAKPIRIIGVPDPTGKLPIIDGENATTPASCDFRWQEPNLIQWIGVVFIVPAGDGAPLPGYIQIKNLEIKNGYALYLFTAENGSQQKYNGFAAGIYIKSGQNVLIENCVIHDCGQAIYNWTGSGEEWWDGLTRDLAIRGCYFYNNGHANSYSEHQTYTEGLRTIIEYCRYGNQRSNALGSHLKDRSAGTVIRYNIFESAPSGWYIDLVEPENGWDALGTANEYKQAFIYGNVLVNKGNYGPNMIHWNEDHGANRGRATLSGGKLFFYNNTVVTVGNRSDFGYYQRFYLFNETAGGYECPSGLLPGVIDVRNNIIAALPRTAGSAVPDIYFGYCKQERFNFGNNWVTNGYVVNGASANGKEKILSPAANDPKFLDLGANNLHLVSGSSAIGIGGDLAPETKNNYLGMDLTPTHQYVYHQGITLRPGNGSGSVVGAFEYSTGDEP